MIQRIAIILLLNLLFFFKTLSYKYSSDDIPVSQRPKDPNKWKEWLGVLNGNKRSTPHIDHFITLMIHALTCVFIYISFGQTNASFLAALLFSVNPANNQGSVWISGRAYVLITLSILMAMSIPLIGPVFFLITTFYNPGFFAPLVLLGSIFSWMCLFLPIAWAINFKRFKRDVHIKASSDMFAEDKKIHWRKLVLATKTFGFYIFHALLPTKNTFYHSFLQSAAGCGKEKAYTMKDRYFWIGATSLIAIAYHWAYVEWNFISFGLLWWCIGIAPFLNLFRVHQEIAERYLYFPNVGLMFVLAFALGPHIALQSAFFAIYATKMWFWMDAYQDDYYLVEYSCINSPNAWFGWHIRAMKRWDVGSKHEALVLWTMARMISPKEFKLNYNLAACLMLCKKREEAYEYLDMAANNIPKGQEKECWEIIYNFTKGKITILT